MCPQESNHPPSPSPPPTTKPPSLTTATTQSTAILRSSLNNVAANQPTILLSRESTFWPSRSNCVIPQHPSFEFLIPSQHNTPSRNSSRASAIFNLVATVCGGGVLTIPIAFCRVGVLPATLMMVASAFLHDFAMYILCSCARRTGGKSYGDVTRIAFGIKAEIFVTILLFVFLVFVVVAYFVLVKDIWTPLLVYVSPWLRAVLDRQFGVDPVEDVIPASDAFLVVFILCSLPLLLQRNLHALRHTCYIGFASLVLLAVAIVKKCGERNFGGEWDEGSGGWKSVYERVKWWSWEMEDWLYAFPIICLSFFSIYNVLTVHSALIDPTRERVKFVLDGTILLCFVLFYTVGICGYLYSYEETKDNILLNFPMTYFPILLGRLGYGFTLMFGLPLVFLPCREALLSIPKLTRRWLRDDGKTDEYGFPSPRTTAASFGLVAKKKEEGRATGITKEGHYVVNGIDFDEERPLLKRNASVIDMPLTEEDVERRGLVPMSRLIPPAMGIGGRNGRGGGVYGATGEETRCDSNTTETSIGTASGEEEGNSAPVMDEQYRISRKEELSRLLVDEGKRAKTERMRFLRQLQNDEPMHYSNRKHETKNDAADNSAINRPCNILRSHKSDTFRGKYEVEPKSSPPPPTKPHNQRPSPGTTPLSPHDQKIHIFSTVLILTLCYICAVAVPGVGLVWSICGSSMSLVIGFTVPAACYLKIRTNTALNARAALAWLMVVFSLVSSVVCTMSIVDNLKK